MKILFLLNLEQSDFCCLGFFAWVFCVVFENQFVYLIATERKANNNWDKRNWWLLSICCCLMGKVWGFWIWFWGGRSLGVSVGLACFMI